MKKILYLMAVMAAAMVVNAQIANGSATVGASGGNGVFPEQQVFPAGSPGLTQMRNGDETTKRRELGPVMGFTTSSYTSPIDGVTTTWAAKDSWKYTGEMYMTAGVAYTFAARIDDESSISIDGRTILTQNGCNFSSATYNCMTTGWHPIVITLDDPGGGQQGVCGGFTPGIAYNTSGQTSQTPLNGWMRLIDSGDGSLLRTTVRTTKYGGVKVVAQMRETDPTVMDVDYIVYTDPATTPTINVRALAFEDGERGFATVVRPETFIEGTDANLGDGIAANVEHRLSWKVSSDWATDLAKVKFEVLAMRPRDLLMPMHLVTIPAADGHPKTDIAMMKFSTTSDDQFYRKNIKCESLLNPLLWLYAEGAESMTLSNGTLYYADYVRLSNGHYVWYDHLPVVKDKYFRIGEGANDFITDYSDRACTCIFKHMGLGYQLLENNSEETLWINENTRQTIRQGLVDVGGGKEYWYSAIKVEEE